MTQLTSEQLGLWIGGLVAVAACVTVIVTAFRAMTRNFVSKDELTAALLNLKDGIKVELDTTRHTLRNEMQAGFLKWEVKQDSIVQNQAALRESMARIEAILYVRSGHEPKIP